VYTNEELAYKLVKTACPHDYGEVHCPACATKAIALAKQIVRERSAALLEARAAELEPLEGKPDLVHWKHGFLLGLASAIRAQL
jgi:hypothetical protein